MYPLIDLLITGSLKNIRLIDDLGTFKRDLKKKKKGPSIKTNKGKIRLILIEFYLFL